MVVRCGVAALILVGGGAARQPRGMLHKKLTAAFSSTGPLFQLVNQLVYDRVISLLQRGALVSASGARRPRLYRLVALEISKSLGGS
jgi:hypothetical protein